MPFFAALTVAADAAHGTLMPHALGLPIIFLVLGLVFAIGRYALKRRGAALFLVLLLTHEFSTVLANILKGSAHRLRPEVQFGAGYAGTGLWASGPAQRLLPLVAHRLILACTGCWRWRFRGGGGGWASLPWAG